MAKIFKNCMKYKKNPTQVNYSSLINPAQKNQANLPA